MKMVSPVVEEGGGSPEDDEVATVATTNATGTTTGTSSNPGSLTTSSTGGGSSINGVPNATALETVLATAGYDHTIKLWQIHTALCVKTFQHPDSQVNDLCITPDRRLIAAAGFQHVRLYDIQGTTQSPTLNFEGIQKNVTAIGFNTDAQWMYTGGEDFNARIWDLRVSNPTCQKLFQTHSSPITSIALHPNNVELIVGDHSGTIHVWDLRNDRTEQLIPDQTSSVPVQHVAIDANGKFLAAVNNKGDCYVWSLDADGDGDHLRLSPFHRMKAHKRYALKCCFSPDSNFLATTSADQTCKIWRTSDFSLVADLHCSGQRWVWGAAFTGDSQYVLTASSDNLARLWSVESGQAKREYNGHQKPVTCVCVAS
ncbi:Target of rapamycin complex subunit lst8 [Orchesella cincta]|uniref:Target of rapamycin complex subunit lst8 n=1 Tax=Orchesella cincta TaxID=48709 RepID=A0A1D2MVW3_ORCCI|nr:Target of rapamycin complex subunit lst8 [Orchesella cincta]